MEKIHLARIHSKFAAAQVTSDRIAANQEEGTCMRDLKDWSAISNTCYSIKELEEKFNDWVSRAVAWDIKKKGMLH